jgi:hypothetical protein
MSQPNFKSWETLRPWVNQASITEVQDALWMETNVFNRGYIKRRLAAAAVRKYRKQLKKKYKL